MEYFFHELVDKSGDERIIECSWLSGDPSVEVSDEFVSPKGLSLFELFDPQFNHFSDILKCFFDLTHFIQRFPLIGSVITFNDQTSGFSILQAQFFSNGDCVDSQIFHDDLDTVVAIDAWVDDFSGESMRLVGGNQIGVEFVPPSDLICWVQ